MVHHPGPAAREPRTRAATAPPRALHVSQLAGGSGRQRRRQTVTWVATHMRRRAAPAPFRGGERSDPAGPRARAFLPDGGRGAPAPGRGVVVTGLSLFFLSRPPAATWSAPAQGTRHRDCLKPQGKWWKIHRRHCQKERFMALFFS
nr:uncharacterized protein LOC105089836 [Camelus dromedarius]